ncbi:MAG: formylmethanofuran dehydrogenase subunit C [Candidatus Methanoperedens sp.]|nr:formylmethanofuran dehydrogenase subunit C [Candidatus Methanoperedens sp.]MCE8428101.1 formylmethanofuran dehydrogenase subunit C [Candidatus Methanoperedens sp.]
MTEIILRPKGRIDIMVEAEAINPDIFAGKTTVEIEQLIVWQGAKQLPLSGFFDVEGSAGSTAADTKIIVRGNVPRVKHIGHGMKAGEIVIEGSAGMHVGSEMMGGSILVKGDAGSWAGMEMKGGTLHIIGNADDHVGCAYRGSWRGMNGGKILIEGNARSQLGGGMNGGEIHVGGSVENFPGIRMNSGLIVVKGDAIRGVGAEMAGGTFVVSGKIEQFSPGFEYVGTEKNPKVGETVLSGEFMKFTGDYAIIKPKGILYASKEANEGV